MEVDNREKESVTEGKNLQRNTKVESGRDGREGRKLDGGGRRETGSASLNEPSATKSTWKGFSGFDSVQPTSASSTTRAKEKERTSVQVEHVAAKNKDMKMSFKNVFKFRRQKLDKESSIDSDSDCANDSFVPFVQESEECSDDEDVQVNADAEAITEVPSRNLPKPATTEAGGIVIRESTRNEGLEKKTGRWQLMKTRLQQKMALPSKPVASLKLESASGKKSVQGKPQLTLESVSVEPPGDELCVAEGNLNSSCDKTSVMQSEQSQQAEQRKSALFRKAVAVPKGSGPSPKILQPSQKSLSPKPDVPPRPQQHVSHNSNVAAAAPSCQMECSSNLATCSRNKGQDIRCEDSFKATGKPFLAKKESRRPSQQTTEVGNVLLHPSDHRSRGSKQEPEPRESSGSVSRDRTFFHAFLRRHRLSQPSVSKTVMDEEEVFDAIKLPASKVNLEPVVVRRAAQFQNLYEDTRTRATEAVEALDPAVLEPPWSRLHDNSLRLHSKAASLPDLINCSSADNKSETSRSPWIAADCLSEDPNIRSPRADNKTQFSQNIPQIEQPLKRNRILSLADYRSTLDPGGFATGIIRGNNQPSNRGNRLNAERFAEAKGRVAPPGESAGLRKKKKVPTATLR